MGDARVRSRQRARSQAVAAIQGKQVQASIGTTLVAITADNMNDPNVSKYFYKGSC